MEYRKTRRIAAFAAVSLSILAASPRVAAQSVDDELFGSGAQIVATPAGTAGDPVSGLFEATKAVVIGGDITIVQSFDPETGELTQAKGPWTQSLGLYFDARPSESFRVYGRGLFTMADSLMSGDFSIQELFADIYWGRTVMVRVGKQAANWGVGRWWSPADILSLTPIDQQDPTAKRAGIAALKVSMPAGLGQLSAYATTQGATDAGDIGFAGRCEFLLGDSELGLGGYWRYDGEVKPRMVGTASARFLGLDWYGEAVGSFGSETKLVRFDSGMPQIHTPVDVLFQGAVGFSWTDTDTEGRWNLHAGGEYYYNGRGAEDPSAYAEHREELRALVGSGRLDASALSGYGRHYAGAAFSAGDLWSSKLGMEGEWRGNLSDSSGYLRTVAAWEPVSDFRLEAGYEMAYGPEGGEYVAGGDARYAIASVRLWTRTAIDIAAPISGDAAEWRLAFLFSGQF